MKKILVLFAHPAFEKSRINRHLIDSLNHLKNVTVNDLYERYPEMDIDVPFEQQLLLEHDVIIFHHPIFWYSTPAILKEWQDLVLTHDWAYGSKGNALRGKTFFNVITTGGPQQAYCKKGTHNYTIRQLLAPLEQTARLCKMVYLPPFVVHGTHSITQQEIFEYQKKYKKLLQCLTEEKIDVDKLSTKDYLNDFQGYFLSP